MKQFVWLGLIVSSIACANPVAPAKPASAPVAPSAITYAINLPDAHLVAALNAAYPGGVNVAPIEAQQRWDYTAAYGGSPNVYFGEQAPHCQYRGVGIVVAPRAVAAVETFTARDWPSAGLQPGVTYAWLGRFAYAAVPDASSYVTDPAGVFCWHP